MNIKEMQDMIEEFKRRVRESVSQIDTENKEIKRINKNCFISNFSTLCKHNNWSPEFYDFECQLRVLEKGLQNRYFESYPEYLKKVLQDGFVKLAERNKVVFHPVFLKRLKEVFDEYFNSK